MTKKEAVTFSAPEHELRLPRGMRLDLVTLRLFVATAEQGGVTRAAGQLHLVPAAASRRIRELEEQLGIALFIRQPHGMALNDAGRAVLAHARSMLHSVDRMQEDVMAFMQGNRGVVRIAACTSAVLQFLSEDIQRCHLRYPNIHIDLHEMNSEGVVQAVQRGIANVGIYEHSVTHVALPHLPYREDRLCIVTQAAHPLAQQARSGARITPEQALRHDVIGLTEGASISIILGRLAEQAGLPLKMRIRVGSFDSMAAMIASGIGIGLMPETVARQIAGDRRFAHLPFDGALAVRHFSLCHQPHASLAQAADSLISLLCTPAPVPH
ncbi:LysR family transcriptional regulator [Paramixta manurensis]|uniref:LysR family transcriptional regulator n=1 Tax=Paramixta manurensis TaxID=2740817 RepID=A0A6M8U7Y7_9GAMM|nr:LysR family transcriptional regulator [Erwiniaceae bacterium PD-1]